MGFGAVVRLASQETVLIYLRSVGSTVNCSHVSVDRRSWEPFVQREFPAFAQFLGGACGYCSQFVCVPYLVSVFENELVGAFLTGDAASSSVIAALIALIQEPASKPLGLASWPHMFLWPACPSFYVQSWRSSI